MQCDECGKDFRPATTWQHFCSPRCRNTHNNRENRNAAYAAEVSAHEARMNGGSAPTSDQKLDPVALGLVKPKPPLMLRPVGAQPKNADAIRRATRVNISKANIVMRTPTGRER